MLYPQSNPLTIKKLATIKNSIAKIRLGKNAFQSSFK